MELPCLLAFALSGHCIPFQLTEIFFIISFALKGHHHIKRGVAPLSNKVISSPEWAKSRNVSF